MRAVSLYWRLRLDGGSLRVRVYVCSRAISPKVPWYGALGNHEYGYSVEAQLQLSAIYPTWILPERYYSNRLQLAGEHYLSLVVIDSSPCVSEYRSSDPAGWDPCSTECVPACIHS